MAGGRMFLCRGQGPQQGGKSKFGKGSSMADGRRNRRHVLYHRPYHPALALGIPGPAPSAVVMAAMITHGIQPGPDADDRKHAIHYEVVAMTSLATCSILGFGLF